MKFSHLALHKEKMATSAKFCAVFLFMALLICSCAPAGAETAISSPIPATPTLPSSPKKLPTSAQASEAATPLQGASPTIEASPTLQPPTATGTAPVQPATQQPQATAKLSQTAAPTPTTPSQSGSDGSTVGFVYPGWKDDAGYTQAAHAGSLELAQGFSGRLKVLENENTNPDDAGAVMEKMIQGGAKIIFVMGGEFGEAVMQIAGRHPDVEFVQPGGAKTAPNVDAPSVNIWEAVYLSGVTAGKMTKNNRLGYVATFPQPGVLLDINAFALGARSVNPAATLRVVFTQSECNSVKQQEAAFTLLDMGTDVMAQDQNCPQTVIEICERNGVMAVGYNVDGAAFAPKNWLTGAIWHWGPLYTNMLTAFQSGQWNTSPYRGRYQGGLKEGLVDLAPFGARVPEDVKTLVLARKQAIMDGTSHPFDGPIKDQAGQVRIPSGARASLEDLQSMNYLVEGVVGNIP